MPKHTLRDVEIKVNGVNLSDHISEVTVEATAEEVDFTSFGPSGYRETGTGFKTATITCTAFQDYDSAKVHQTVQPLFDGGSTFPVTVKQNAAATLSPTNPMATMTARVLTYTGIGGAAGDASSTPLSFTNASTAGLVWSTA